MSQDVVIDEGYPVSEAAEIIGISPAAVRKRIKRGTLDAVKRDGQWYIMLDVEEYGGEPPQAEPIVTDDVAMVLAQQQMEVFRETFVTPLVEAIRELEHENGRLEERVKQLTEELEERDQENIEDIDKPWWRFW